MHIVRSIIAAVIVYLLGVSAFVASFYVPILDNAELQANLVLTLTLIPAAVWVPTFTMPGHHIPMVSCWG